MATHGKAHLMPGPNPHGGGDPGREFVEYEAFIEAQLRKTRSHVRGVDIACSLMTLSAGTLGFVLLAAMLDHWVLPGGLGFWGRLLLLSTYVVVAVGYLVTQVAPLVLKRINPVYAAHTIERSRPSLKNGLVNFLFFRANPAGMSPLVYQAIEEQAATNLAAMRVDAAVDRTKLIRIGYALLGILVVCALYTVLSPKDLFKTVGRVVMPWAEINPPTRTAIVDIQPGNAQAFRGQQVAVSARIQGLPADGKVLLVYSTADGQVMNRPVEMQLADDGYRHVGVLPGGDSTLQQNLEYRIEAGDATSSRFHLDVVAAPTIVVQAVHYKYPAYTGLLERRVERQGDIKAIEGTEVTIEALANQDIRAADLDFDCDQKPDQRMRAEKQQAKVTFRLALKDDRKTPQHDSYQVLFKNDQGQQNPQPVRQQIEITRDVAPEIQFVTPKQDEIDLPLNEVVQLEIVANDPDFALKQVKLSATQGKKPLFGKLLLDEARRGQFVSKFRFEPRRLGLKAGDVVEYSAVAEDTKAPGPNRTETLKRRIRIVSPNAKPSQQDQVANNGQQGAEQTQPGDDGQGGNDEQPRDKNQPADPQAGKPEKQPADPTDNAADDGQRQPGTDGHENGQDEKNPGEPGADGKNPDGNGPGKPDAEPAGDNKSDKQKEPPAAEPSVPSDGSDDGGAIDKILKHRQEQQDKSKPQPKGSQGQKQNSPQESGGQQPKGQQQDGQQKDGQQGSSEQQQKDDQQPGAGKQADDQQAGEQSAGEKQGQSAQPQGDKSDPGAGKQGQQGQSGKDQQGKGKGQQGKGAGKQESSGQEGERSGDGQAAGKESSRPGKQSQSGKPTPTKPGAKSTDDGKSDDAADDAQSGQSPQGDKPKNADAKADPQGSDDGAGQGKAQSRRTKPGDSKDRTQPKSSEQAPGEGDADPQAAGGKEPGKKPTGKSPDKSGGADKKDKAQDDPDAQKSNTPEQGQPDGEAKEGQGAKSADDPTRDAGQKPSRDPQKPDAKGGDGENQKGQSGSGQSSSDNKGSPSPTETPQPREKSQQPSSADKDAKPESDAQSPAHSKRESKSQGGDDGDRSGGGKRGGGQKANKPGTGGPGQNTAADEGAGKSDEPGDGETGERGGQGPQADKPTGKSGSDKGKGSATRPSSDPGKAGQGEVPPGGKPQPSNSNSNRPQTGPNRDQAPGGQPQGASPNGPSPEGKPSEQAWQPGEDHEDAANLEFARKASDLALEHLKDQLKKDEPDAELMNRLGWTRQDLENFVKRWEQMRKQAQTPGERGATSRQELDETLRSLGLRPRATSLKGNAARDDKTRGLKESRRTSPPAEYSEQTKAYTQGTATGGK